MIKFFYFLFALLLLPSCFFKTDILVDGIAPDKKIVGGSATKANLLSLSVSNDQLVINGTHLGQVESIRIMGSSGFDETFAIESKTSSQIIVNGLSDITFAVGSIFNLIISDAHGAATFQVNFSLQDGIVTAAKLSDMGAGIGQVLKYDGTTWVPSDLAGLTYAGNWSADTNSPDLSGGGNPGEFYIVQSAGSFDLLGGTGTNSWAVGDWVVWNNVIAQWEKIDNTTSIQSFNGRSGVVISQVNDYTWAQINKAASSLNDIADVDTSGLANDKVLKWNGSAWIISDDLKGADPNSITATEISDGTITDLDISSSANIAQTKISGLSTDLSNKLALSGGTMGGDILMGANNITFSTGLVDGVDVSALKATVDSNVLITNANSTAIVGKQNQITDGNNGEFLSTDGSGNFIFLPIDKTTVGLDNVTNIAQLPLSYLDTDVNLTAEDNSRVPSQNAVKKYVDTKFQESVEVSTVPRLRDNKVRSYINSNENNSGVISSTHINSCSSNEVYVMLEGLKDGGGVAINDMGFCLDTAVRTAATWSTALATCQGEGKRLPRDFEWLTACERKATLGLTGMSASSEWIGNYSLTIGSDGYYLTAQTPYAGECSTTAFYIPNFSINSKNLLKYRCAR